MNSFQEEIEKFDLRGMAESCGSITIDRVRSAMASDRVGLREFLALVSPVAAECLEDLAQRSRSLTLARFGRVIQLYAPLYLSSYCINDCSYCGFRSGNQTGRKRLTPDAAVGEANFLYEQGVRSVLLVAGEDPERCGVQYIKGVVNRLHGIFPSVSLEIGPQSVQDYAEIRTAGAEGVVVYQETYERSLYERFHASGTKKDYFWRLETPERVARAGFHRVGIGALLGLGDPVYESIALYLHASFLLKNHWNTRVAISLPRMREARGGIAPPNPVDDKTFIRIICALRIAFPEIGIVISTREEPALRDGIVRVGVTQLSAGSRTEPGGYLEPDTEKEQFQVEDPRSPDEVAKMLASKGYEPVWKDWEATLV